MNFKTIATISFSVFCMHFLANAHAQSKCETDTDKECEDAFGSSYAVCENKTCKCEDFFGFDGNTCIKGVRVGKKCSDDAYCNIALNSQVSRCHPTSKLCECHEEVLGRPVAEMEGKCYLIRKLTEPCHDDKECILGSNEFSRCVNSTCQCHSSDEADFMAGGNGRCHIMSAELCTDTSVLAVTISISAAIFVILVVLFMVTKRTGGF